MNITVHIAHVFHVKRLGKEVLQRGSASLSCCVPEDRPVSCQLGILVSWAPSDGAPPADNSAPPVSSCAPPACDGARLTGDGVSPTSE